MSLKGLESRGLRGSGSLLVVLGRGYLCDMLRGQRWWG